MSKVNADPQALRNVRSAIHQGQTDIERAVANMRSALRSADWNDERRRQFEQDLEGLLGSLKAFSARADEMKSHLDRKANQLDQFLQR